MPREAIRPSLALGRLLRQGREALGLSLRDVSAHTADQGELIPASTILRIEQGKTEPGARRLVRLLRLYEIPAEQAADLIQMTERAPRGRGDWKAMYEEGLRRAKAGDFRNAFGLFLAIRDDAPKTADTGLLHEKTLLSLAITARNLGQVRIGLHMIDQLLVANLNLALRISTLLIASSLWLSRGSRDAASAFVREAEALVASTPAHDPARAMVEHQRALLLQDQGQTEEALRAVNRAAAAYRVARDVGNVLQAKLLRVMLLRDGGRRTEALRECRVLRKSALEEQQPQAAVMAILREGQLLVDMDAVEDARQRLREGLSEAVALEDRFAEFFAHHQLWKAAEKAGDRAEARFELQAARYYVRFLDESLPEVIEVRSKHEVEERGVHDRRSRKRKAPPRRH